MPNRFRKLPQADLDLDSIWNFIAVDDVQAADRLMDRIGGVFQMLVENPLAGRERPELRRNLRSFPVGNYLIFYSPVSDGVEVIRVMNSRQDIDADDMA
ncbi:type II toxin-antitoxin system RelE/ParE family toxin [Bradyrhizobium paxllaeri]|uniref:type II toxin-antitoxin system RelE/ParE family toxin n=1 Tax=Bradyrhizobium paxllaeri TaxID=190148 RepID=UPI000810E410|nr:type II toxin-antitoxin system RelE/ParE family toxin [Bradyrhizobium paxllaeri]